MSELSRSWVIIPAAGVGKRMRLNHPKQYLSLDSKTVIERAILVFSKNPNIEGIVIVLSSGDEYWPKLKIDSKVPLFVVEGGQERCHSVLNGLLFLENKAKAVDWVLVHDAARPCLHNDDVTKLSHTLQNHDVGGLLGLPVADTLKYCDDGYGVKRTVNRQGLWRALTPQMFRYEKLLTSMRAAVCEPENITDEASAMEMAGYEPVMVEGRWDNIKITHPQDISQAQLILKGQKCE